MSKQMWEILVPCTRRNGRTIPERFHRVWDKEVEKVSGGITLNPSAKGRWIHQGKRIEERMIPVRILCTEAEINTIIDFTLRYYDQTAVLAYRISDKVILREKPNEHPAR